MKGRGTPYCARCGGEKAVAHNRRTMAIWCIACAARVVELRNKAAAISRKRQQHAERQLAMEAARAKRARERSRRAAIRAMRKRTLARKRQAAAAERAMMQRVRGVHRPHVTERGKWVLTPLEV